MALTKVTSGMVNPDPTNASNLSSGDVPLAQLGNAPATDTTTIEDDIALLGFKVAVNGSLAKYNLVDQTEDAFMDATGIDAVASTNDVRNAKNYYSGTSTAPTGGTITTYTDGATDYTVHTFLSSSSFVASGSASTDILVVAGGGSGASVGGGAGGGGGGGGVLEGTLSLSAATYAITVGAGASQSNSGGDSGLDSVWDSSGTPATADGGGGGTTLNAGSQSGGSGGGGGQTDAGGATTQSTSGGLTGYGYVGGYGGAQSRSSGGGGGAGAVGQAGNYGSSDHSGAGGAGRANVYRTGASVTYAGGGGGGHDAQLGDAGAGGAGGGGAGGDNAAGTAGTVNTGGGGGGGLYGQAGGSGIVVVRFVTGAFSSALNMTLQSNSTTAEAAPTKGDIVMTYTNGAGTATLNTDLTAEFSADNGSTWTSTTLVAQGSTGTHLIVSAHDVTRTSTSGTAMKYRVKTLNQSAAKETRIQAVSLGWS